MHEHLPINKSNHHSRIYLLFSSAKQRKLINIPLVFHLYRSARPDETSGTIKSRSFAGSVAARLRTEAFKESTLPFTRA